MGQLISRRKRRIPTRKLLRNAGQSKPPRRPPCMGNGRPNTLIECRPPATWSVLPLPAAGCGCLDQTTRPSCRIFCLRSVTWQIGLVAAAFLEPVPVCDAASRPSNASTFRLRIDLEVTAKLARAVLIRPMSISYGSRSPISRPWDVQLNRLELRDAHGFGPASVKLDAAG